MAIQGYAHEEIVVIVLENHFYSAHVRSPLLVASLITLTAFPGISEGKNFLLAAKLAKNRLNKKMNFF